MSELLVLASALRASEDAEIRKAIETRKPAISLAKDFFDLADSFLNVKSANKVMASMPGSLIKALQDLVSGKAILKTQQDGLKSRFLIYEENGVAYPYESVTTALGNLKKITNDSSSVASKTEPVSNQEIGQQVFLALQCLSEFLYDLEFRFVREIGKNGISLADIKRMASYLKQSQQFVKDIFEMARSSNLIRLAEGRWQPTEDGQVWLDSTAKNRWLLLAKWALEELDHESRSELLELHKKGHTRLDELIRLAFPLAESSPFSSKFQSAVNLLGLCSNLSISENFTRFLKGDLESIAAELSSHMPTTQDRLICQADLTLVAPGPLSAAAEKMLRLFVEVEHLGIASSYRINSLSLSHGFETGLTVTDVTELLKKLSSRELPQPLSYLIREAGQKFGQLRVTQSLVEHVCTISSSDLILLKQIENDSRLRHLSLKRSSTGALQSKLDSELVYNSMRSVGYSVVRTDGDGKVISPRQQLTTATHKTQEDPIGTLLKYLRAQGEVEESVEDDRVRKIQLALKNKSPVEVVVKTNSGDELLFTLEPLGLANNRLRARDRKADIERTLPLDKIVRVEMSR